MKGSRLTALVLIILLIVVAFIWGGATKEGEGKKKIAFSVFTMEWEFFQAMEAGARRGAEELGYEYILHDQKNDQAEMVSGCQILINQGIAALVVSPCLPDPLPAIVEAAHKKGIPVVICDIGTGDSNHDGIVISDNYKGGVENAQAIIKEAEKRGMKKEYVSMRGIPQFVYANRRNTGMEDTLDAAGWKMLDYYRARPEVEIAYQVMQDILAAHPDVRVVMMGADSQAAGVAQAFMDAGITDFLTTGGDATDQGMINIQEGLQFVSMQQFPYDMAWTAMEVADKILKGESPDYSDPMTKEIFIPTVLIDITKSKDLDISLKDPGLKWKDIK